MLFLIAMAQPGSGQQQPGIGMYLPMIAVFLIFWFLILRPQAKRQKQHQAMLDQLTKGEKVVTSGGIHGTITNVNDSDGTLLIKIAGDLKITVDRSAVTRKLNTSPPEDIKKS
ncbi:preprotein translocase subunit YajC [Calditrichota bacterium]